MTACGPSVPPLADTRESASDLAQAVLAALEQRDRPALLALALDEREFRDHVWPELPAAEPERNLPFSFVWGDLRQKSEGSLARTLGEYGGRHYELVHLNFRGGTTQYRTYLVHRETELTVRDATGESRVQLFGSVLEKDGRFKVFSYVVD
jgi:hypothetical protein